MLQEEMNADEMKAELAKMQQERMNLFVADVQQLLVKYDCKLVATPYIKDGSILAQVNVVAN